MKEIIQRAMKDKRILEIVYIAKDGTISQRSIRVLSLKGEVVIAYCFLRGKKRMFQIGQFLAAYPVKDLRHSIG